MSTNRYGAEEGEAGGRNFDDVGKGCFNDHVPVRACAQPSIIVACKTGNRRCGHMAPSRR